MQGTEPPVAGQGVEESCLQVRVVAHGAGCWVCAVHWLLHGMGQGLGAFVACSNVTCFPISLMNGLCWHISDVRRMPVSAIYEMTGVREGSYLACDWQKLSPLKL